MSVDQSGGLRMEIGVLYLSHAMLVPAELTVCSTRGFACILAKWFWPTVMRRSLTYEVPRPHVISEPHKFLLATDIDILGLVRMRRISEDIEEGHWDNISGYPHDLDMAKNSASSI